MLDQSKLKADIKQAIDDIFPSALEEGLKSTFTIHSVAGDDSAKRFAETITNMISDPFADSLAQAIDYYIKNAQIHGSMMLMGVKTVGGSTSQTQVAPLTLQVNTMPTGLGGGSIPGVNTFILGIK